MKRNICITGICVVLLMLSGGYLYGGQTTGVTDNSIKVGCLVDLTGPASFLGRATNVSTESYFKYLNDKGGVNGRNIKYIGEDHGYQPAKSVAAMKKLVFRDKIFAICFSWGSVTTYAIVNEVQREKIPTIFYGNSEPIFKPFKRYFFSFLTTLYREAFTITDYIVTDMKAKEPKFACIYQDDEYGKSGLRGFKAAAKAYGVKWVGEASYKRGALDFTSQVLKLKKAGADYIALASVTREAAGVLREADKLGWHPYFFGTSAATDEKLLELAGKAAKGYMGSTYVVAWHEDIPRMKKVRKTILKYHGTLKGMTHTATTAWVGSMLFSEGLKRAGRSLTREGLVDALETIKDFESGGLMTPITWGPERREGGIGSRILKADLKKKVFVPVTGWKIPNY